MTAWVAAVACGGGGGPIATSAPNAAGSAGSSAPWMADGAAGARVGRQLVLGVLLDLAPVRDVLQVLVERFGEGVPAGAVGDEIQVPVCAGLATASSAALPGLEIGPGGRPSMT